MKNIIECYKCKLPYKPLIVSTFHDYGEFICPECYKKITIHAPIEGIKLFT